ncbi:hypothetical protein EJ06DRAFT_524171 [Trichodelitschia bisporula]|uniref:Capsule polysaccharide biosynthesis protein n=1 Tax=Trichodelitschia bisporula TaxID=703511 RepID=A0A6G1HMN8_9PEZI|nr:hypothetical protein EJ06DRAFT_524171 [Trichodelitschia bisporula]
MSAARRLPVIAGIVAAGTSLAAVAAQPSARNTVARFFGGGHAGFWKAAALVLMLLNFKNLPFIWHIRLFRALIYHLFTQPTPIEPRHLFHPIITSSHAPLLETDYNMHKSNSTYFTDCDITRTRLVTALLRNGITNVKANEGENTGWSFRNSSRAAGHREGKAAPGPGISALGTSGPDTAGTSGEAQRRPLTREEWENVAAQPGNVLIALGGVSCHFHREIAPYKRYELWTRLLTWDRKWLYVVTYFVERGAFRPTSFDLQPWRRAKPVKEWTEVERRRKVFATSIAKYVVKKGRLTLPPELVLQRSQMLPPKPEGARGAPWEGVSGYGEGSSGEETLDTPGSSPGPEVLAESLFPGDGEGKAEEWTWEMVERERRRGLRFAEAFNSLDGLREEFEGEGAALGEYADLAFGY